MRKKEPRNVKGWYGEARPASVVVFVLPSWETPYKQVPSINQRRENGAESRSVTAPGNLYWKHVTPPHCLDYNIFNLTSSSSMLVFSAMFLLEGVDAPVLL